MNTRPALVACVFRTSRHNRTANSTRNPQLRSHHAYVGHRRASFVQLLSVTLLVVGIAPVCDAADDGAAETWWSLRPLKVAHGLGGGLLRSTPAAPANPIDHFVLARLSEQGLQTNPPANRRALIRRATYDLTGLPPTPEEVREIASDPDPVAYEKLIDRLLASPHYGERWGRHWLDVVRFGESIGFERNVITNNLWPFRDYVIRSINEDKPFDRFIREHLAGDVLGKDHPEIEIGSAFLVAGPYDDVTNQDPAQIAQIRANTIDEIIRATSEAFLGLTVGCARCHDHKFDPILQRDYYSLYATFSGVRHGSRVLATVAERATYEVKLDSLVERRDAFQNQRDLLTQTVMKRALERAAEYEKRWSREPVNRQGTEETFTPVDVKFVRLVSEGQDDDPNNTTQFNIDEFEVWSAEREPRNVALTANGGRASGASRQIEDFPGAYGPQLAIDGKTGARFLATGGKLTIELADPTSIDRVFFSSARGEATPEYSMFRFVGEYQIEISNDGTTWTTVANSYDRQPVNDAHRNQRLRESEITEAEKSQLAHWNRQIREVQREIDAIPPLPSVWVGTRVAADAQGPFHVFLGGSPKRKGDEVVPASLAGLGDGVPVYALGKDSQESERRRALADWLVHPDNPLTPRVLANRLWHYHFGTGIVDTPNDFGFMGGKPTHPELLDWLAAYLIADGRSAGAGWRLKPLHKLIMTSQTYRQSDDYRADAARVDGDSRRLWRFPPRRLSAEEIRDTMLTVSGKLDTRIGGPGFRLYQYMADNVSTYVPLDKHGTTTYRRAVYHQNARASVVDLMTDFDQPDCAFSAPKRAETTTPLQALTMLNHNFSLDMARFLAERLEREVGTDRTAQVRRLYTLCYGRQPTEDEAASCVSLLQQHSLAALCRVILNTSELVYVR